MIIAILLVFVPLLVVEGFFATAEISLISANHRRLKYRAEEGHRGAKAALRLLERPERMVATAWWAPTWPSSPTPSWSSRC